MSERDFEVVGVPEIDALDQIVAIQGLNRCIASELHADFAHLVALRDGTRVSNFLATRVNMLGRICTRPDSMKVYEDQVALARIDDQVLHDVPDFMLGYDGVCPADRAFRVMALILGRNTTYWPVNGYRTDALSVSCMSREIGDDALRQDTYTFRVAKLAGPSSPPTFSHEAKCVIAHGQNTIRWPVDFTDPAATAIMHGILDIVPKATE